MYVFVAATARSVPAPVTSARCATPASVLSSSLVIASVKAPAERARATYSATSGVSPLWLMPMTRQPLRSMRAR